MKPNPKPIAAGPLHQWSPTLGLQMFLDFKSQKSWPAEVVVKASGSCSARTSGGPRLGTTALGWRLGWHTSPSHACPDSVPESLP